ncbi:MAG: glycosyltransferase family 4 protein [Acidobacteria bacterium]|nr:glycosyltransferase family 4 protein [Acidobacteriota bacterium]
MTRIGIDFRPALKKNSQNRGVGRYTRQLANALLNLSENRSYCLYTLKGHPVEGSQRCELRYIPALPRPSRLNWLLDLVLLPPQIRKDGLDIFHATELTSIPSGGRVGETQVWATVHDLIPFVFWQETVRSVPPDYCLALKRAKRVLKDATRIVTDSAHSKKDLVELFGISAERIEVVYLGCEDLFKPVDPGRAAALVQRKYGICGPFVFYVGGSDFRKNISRLIAAFWKIRQRGYAGRLVLSGETFGAGRSEGKPFRELVSSLGIEGAVTFTDHIPDEDLPCFFSACDCFVLPSLYEGFGLPLLEAFRCGAPVLASNTSAIPEVGGEAALYFDPLDVSSIVQQFFRLRETPGLASELRERGFIQAQSFSWAEMGRQVSRLYTEFGPQQRS